MSIDSAKAAFKAGQFAIARKECELFLSRNPLHIEAYEVLASSLSHLGELDGAIQVYERGLRLAPTNIALRIQLATCLVNCGNIDLAIGQWRLLLDIRPDLLEIRFNLGRALLDQGYGDEAISHFRMLATVMPGSQTFSFLGNALLTVGRIEEAAEHYQMALAESPEDTKTRHNLASTWRLLGEPKKAEVEYLAVLSKRNVWGDRIENAMLLPVIYDSTEDVHYWRNRLIDAINELNVEPIKFENPLQEFEYSDFYLAYQGLNDRNIKTTAAAMFKRSCPQLNFHAPHCSKKRNNTKRIRIGFLSAYFSDRHPNGRMVKGYIEQLDRSRFEVFVIHVTASGQAAYATAKPSLAIHNSADHVITLTNDLWHAQQEMAKFELDAILFFDIGMDQFSYFLAFARLARVQCSCFGHPETTGIENVDYVISADAWEPSDAENHYSERLLRINNVAVPSYYYRPYAHNNYPSAINKLNLPSKARLYLCAQTVWKYHPDFDNTIRRILELDPQGYFICVEMQRRWVDKLAMRFSRTLGPSAQRVHFIPWQNENDWASLIASVDVVIDTPHFTGMTSTLDILSVGTPVVTWPGEFARGRQTFGIYNSIGLEGCIGTTQIECADLAIGIASNGEYRRFLSEQIAIRLPQVFEQRTAVSQIEEFLEQSIS